MKIDRSVWSLIAAIFFVSFLVYWPNPRMGFVLDDHYVIARNPLVKNPSLYPQIFNHSFFSAAHRVPESGLNYYRPLLTASFAVDYKVWGGHAYGYRLVNILIHVVNSILVFILLWLIFKRQELAALASLIFCILPEHEWVVRYITGRGDSLQTFFNLLSLIALERSGWVARREFFSRPQRQRGREESAEPALRQAQDPEQSRGRPTIDLWLILSLISFIAALLTREVAVSNVSYVFLVSYFVTRDIRRTIKIFLPFFACAAVYYVLRNLTFPISGDLASLNLPHGLELTYQYFLHFFSPSFIHAIVPEYFSLILFSIAAGFIWWKLAKSKDSEDRAIVQFGAAWILLGIFPFIITQKVVDRLGPLLSEHFLYFAAIGFALLLAWVLTQIQSVLIRKVVCVLVLLYSLSVSFVNGYFWQSEEKIMRHVRAIEGKEFTVADEQLVMRFDNDVEKIKRLIEHSPSASSRSVWLKRLGNIYRTQKDYPLAIKYLNEAVAVDPANVEAFNELAVAYWETVQMPQGFAAIDQALKVDPYNSEAYRLLGLTFYLQGDFARAIVMLNRACLYDPQDQEARSLLRDVMQRVSRSKM